MPMTHRYRAKSDSGRERTVRAQVTYDTEVAERLLAAELEKITPWSENEAAGALQRSA